MCAYFHVLLDAILLRIYSLDTVGSGPQSSNIVVLPVAGNLSGRNICTVFEIYRRQILISTIFLFFCTQQEKRKLLNVIGFYSVGDVA